MGHLPARSFDRLQRHKATFYPADHFSLELFGRLYYHFSAVIKSPTVANEGTMGKRVILMLLCVLMSRGGVEEQV